MIKKQQTINLLKFSIKLIHFKKIKVLVQNNLESRLLLLI